MKQYKILTYCFITVLCAIFAVSCVDDDLYNPADYGEGMANVTAQVTFDCYTDALNQSRSAGTSLDDISSLQILVYDLDGNIVRTQYYTNPKTETIPAPKYEYDQESGQNVLVGSEDTRRTTIEFNNQLAYGRYYIYAVANVDHNIPSDSVATREQLRDYPLVWYSTVTKNAQMLGTFSEEPQASYNNETTVDINKPNQTIHAWVRRAASKVTVAYDATNLDDNVYVYIHSVRIHDIPKRSTLGGSYSVKDKSDLIPTGEILYYDSDGNISDKSTNWVSNRLENMDDPSIIKDDLTTGDREDAAKQFSQWLVLANGKGKLGSVEHTRTDQAMFFYENMQGNYPNETLYDKRQYAKEEGGTVVKDKDWSKNDVSEKSDWKDRVPNGTWIEVRGYYENHNVATLSSGPIIYRFMLGKDEKFNYDCERNHHYKLTLKFNGQANNADWHIDYKEPTPDLSPMPTRISYYYGQQAILPVKVRLPKDAYDIEIRADILENNWRPVKYNDPTWKNTRHQDLYDNFRKSASKAPTYVKKNLAANVSGSTICKNYNAFGFLSLRNVEATDKITEDNNCNDIDNVIDWFDKGKGGWREYKMGGNLPQSGHTITYQQDDGETFTCSATEDDEGIAYLYQLPIYTQPRVLGGWAVFSGSNSFEWSGREAIVTIKLTYKVKGSTNTYQLTKDVTVTQDPKVINPVGIWRRSTNTQPFNVVLQEREAAEGDFTPLISKGPWKAYVEWGDKSLVKLSKLGESMKYGDTIKGKTDSQIEFRYTPNGTSVSEPRFAVIKIEYHNYSCFHYIFVRQGYQDVTIHGTTWSTFNLYKKDTRCVSPLSIGSFFRRGNMDQAITEKTNETYGLGKNPAKFWINGTTTTSSWSGITGVTNTNYTSADNWTIGTKYRLPSDTEMESIIADISGQYVFGVVYADGATEVATSQEEAFGFVDTENNITSSKKGVRGVIYADHETYYQLLFPLGKEGHGRRNKGNTNTSVSYIKFYNGELRYPGVSGPLELSSGTGTGTSGAHRNWYRPLAYDTYYQPGATYWLNCNSNMSKYVLDINFRVWRFNFYPKSEMIDADGTRGSDACPIKPVL